MKTLKQSLLTFLSFFIFGIYVQAQGSALQNKGVFCYKTGNYILNSNEVNDSEGNKYITIQSKDEIYFNGNLVFTPQNTDVHSTVIIKTTINNELIWVKSITGIRLTPYPSNNGIVAIGFTNRQEDITIDDLPTITNDGKLMYYAVTIDSTGNDVNLFPLIIHQAGLPILINPAGPQVNFDNDTIIITGVTNASLRFGRDDVLINHPNFRSSFYIARFTSEGDFIDVDFLYYAGGNIAPNFGGLEIIDNKVYCLFNYTDTLRSEKDESILALPYLTPGLEYLKTPDLGLLCYDLRNKEQLWLKPIITHGAASGYNMEEWGDNIYVWLKPFSSIIKIVDSTFETQTFSNWIFTFDKLSGELTNNFVIETANEYPAIKLNVENSSSLFLSGYGIEDYISINGDKRTIESLDESYYFRISLDNTIGYLGKTSTYGTLKSNKAGVSTVFLSSISPDNSSDKTVSVFGTDLTITPCIAETNVSFVYADLSQLTSVSKIQHTQTILSIYPNPANNKINIETLSVGNPYFIMDIQGRILQQGTLEKTKSELDVSSLSSGIYFVKVENDVRKIVVE